jgi:syntaxin 1B/2/3
LQFLHQLNRFTIQDTSIQQGIQQLRENITQISTLRIQSLHAIGEAGHTEMEKIDSLTSQTRTLIQDLKERIKRLESVPIQQDVQLRKNRVTSIFSNLQTPF